MLAADSGGDLGRAFNGGTTGPWKEGMAVLSLAALDSLDPEFIPLFRIRLS